MERELRRYKNLLACVGTGVITFGIWSVIKAIMTVVRDKDDLLMLLKWLLGEQYAELAMIILGITAGVIIAIDLVLRFGTGMAARRDGMDIKKGKHRVYLFFAFLLLAGTILSLIYNFNDMAELGALSKYITNNALISPYVDMILEVTVQTIVDATSAIMIIEMIVAGIKVGTLERKMKKAEAMEGAS